MNPTSSMPSLLNSNRKPTITPILSAKSTRLIKVYRPVKSRRMLYRPEARPNPTKAQTSIAQAEATDHTRARNRQIETLKSEILHIQSDKYELMRDLATYEFAMGSKLGILSSLVYLQHVSSPVQIPEYSGSFHQTLNSGLSSLYNLEPRKLKPEVMAEKYPVHSVSPYTKMAHLMNCIRKISGIYCVINVNRLYSELILNVSCSFGLNFQLEVAMLDDTDEGNIKTKVLPYLYFHTNGGDTVLKWSKDYKTKFINLFIKVKTISHPILVHLEEFDTLVSIYVSITKQSIDIQKHAITKKHSIFNCTDEELIKILSQNLVYEKSEHLMLWEDEPLKKYNKKERLSNLMNISYVHSVLGSLPFQVCKEAKITVDNVLYKVTVMAFAEFERIEISNGKRVERINMESSKWIKQLQFSRLKENPLTVIYSLELRHTIRHIFNN